jgi:hypothetical protein
MEVKYCGLVTEAIGNTSLPSTGGNTANVRVALAISTLMFGLLEGFITCWKSVNEKLTDEKSQLEGDSHACWAC